MHTSFFLLPPSLRSHSIEFVFVFLPRPLCSSFFLLVSFVIIPPFRSQTGQIGEFTNAGWYYSLSHPRDPLARHGSSPVFIFLSTPFLALTLSSGTFSFYATWLILVSTVGFFTLSQIVVWFLALYVSPSHVRADFEVLLKTTRKPLVSHLLVTGRLEAARPRRAGQQGGALRTPNDPEVGRDGAGAEFDGRSQVATFRRSSASFRRSSFSEV